MSPQTHPTIDVNAASTSHARSSSWSKVTSIFHRRTDSKSLPQVTMITQGELKDAVFHRSTDSKSLPPATMNSQGELKQRHHSGVSSITQGELKECRLSAVSSITKATSAVPVKQAATLSPPAYLPIDANDTASTPLTRSSSWSKATAIFHRRPEVKYYPPLIFTAKNMASASRTTHDEPKKRRRSAVSNIAEAFAKLKPSNRPERGGTIRPIDPALLETHPALGPNVAAQRTHIPELSSGPRRRYTSSLSSIIELPEPTLAGRNINNPDSTSGARDRRSLKKSGDYIGVTGANPRTGKYDPSSSTTTSTVVRKDNGTLSSTQKMIERRKLRWRVSADGWTSFAERSREESDDTVVHKEKEEPKPEKVTIEHYHVHHHVHDHQYHWQQQQSRRIFQRQRRHRRSF